MTKQVTDQQVVNKWIQLKERAESKNIDFDLSLTSIRNLLKAKKCFYTGTELTFETNSQRGLSIDRIDSSKGYVKGNVCACTRRVNSIKGNLTSHEIKMLANKLDKLSKKN